MLLIKFTTKDDSKDHFIVCKAKLVDEKTALKEMSKCEKAKAVSDLEQ